MNLVKWFRKNNTKVMAIVVIVLMVGFIGGSSLSMLLRGDGGADETIASYGKKGKITPRDRNEARGEIEILQAMAAPQMLYSVWQGRQNMGALLLSELLFSGDRASAAAVGEAKQAIQRYGYRISDRQLKDMYEQRTVPADIYWILLREEAQAAGFYVGPETVGQQIGPALSQLFNVPYTELMKSMVSRFGVQEKVILSTFGRLLAVLQYAEAACSTENLTTSQIKHMAQAQGEMLNADVVQLKASYFVDKTATPSETELTEQFGKYKDIFPGAASAANPYGFGYKLPDRVQLDYIAVKLEDIKAKVKSPTDEEAERYYRENRAQLFTRDVQTDPNDPNSWEPQVRPYAEVADEIAEQLMREKINRRAEEILLEVSTQANTDLEVATSGQKEPAIEELKQKAGKYEEIAQAVGQQYSVTLYSGRTGWLSPADIQDARYLNRLSLKGPGERPVRLSQLIFSAKAFGDSAVTLLSMPEPQLYRTIGPVQDPAARGTDFSEKIMAVVRIVGIEPAAAPESLDTTYSTKTMRIGDLTADEEDGVYAVREKVAEDLKVLAAWETTKTRAQQFVEMAAKDGWEETTKKFNELYGEQAKSDPNDPNVFQSQNLFGLRRIPQDQLKLIETQRSGIPGTAALLRQLNTRSRFVERLFQEAPDAAAGQTQDPKVMEFKPEQSYYCIKSIDVNPLNDKQFAGMKGGLLQRESHVEAQSLAIVHLNPANILKRTGFQWAPDVLEEEAQDQKTKETPEDAA